MTRAGREFRIANRVIGMGRPVFVIAEIGINHDGSESKAAEMIDAAAAAGADAVKFQTVDASESYLPGTPSYEAFAGRGLTLDAYCRLKDRARKCGLVMFSTPGDLASLQTIVASGMPAIKISSGQMTNTPILRAVARTGLPLIVSTGMADLAAIRAVLSDLQAHDAGPIALLHCTSLYPAPADTLNLTAIQSLNAEFGLPTGYSDHYLGSTAVIGAVALGACIIEKHFSLDRTLPGADHHLSAEPDEFARMVHEIREMEKMLGSGDKRPTDEERRLAPERWRYLVARRDLEPGTCLTPDDVVAKRVAGDGPSVRAADIDSVTGRRLKASVAKNALITLDDLEPLS